MKTSHVYSLSSTKQLIDLNGDTVNFDINFTVTTKNQKPFDMIVIDQIGLDNNPTLEYKTVQTTISGHLVADKNVYQNYFIILKSSEKAEVEVVIDKTEIPPNIETPPPVVEKALGTQEPVKSSKKMNIKLILVIVVLLVGSFFLYKFYTAKSKPSVIDLKPAVSPSPSYSAMSATSDISVPKVANRKLIDKLNSINI